MRDLLNEKDKSFHEYKELFKAPEATYLEGQVQRQNLLISLKSAILDKQSKAIKTKFESSEPEQIPVTNDDTLLKLVEAAIEEKPFIEITEINGTDIERDYYKNKRDIDKHEAEITMYKKLSESEISNERTHYLVFNSTDGSWTLNNQDKIPEKFQSTLNELIRSLNTEFRPLLVPDERRDLHVDARRADKGNWDPQYPFLYDDGHAGLLALAVDNLVNTFNDEDKYNVALDNFNAVYNALCVPAYSHGADPNSRKKQALENFKQAVSGGLITHGLGFPTVETIPELTVEPRLQPRSDSINANDDFNSLLGKREFYRVKGEGDFLLEISKTTNERWSALTEQVSDLIEKNAKAAIALGTKLKNVKKPLVFFTNAPLLKPLTDAVLETLQEIDLPPPNSNEYQLCKEIALGILSDKCESQGSGLSTELINLQQKVKQINDVKEICEIAQQVAGLARPILTSAPVDRIKAYAVRVIERERRGQDPDLKKLIQEVKWISSNRFKDTSTWGGAC